VVVVLKSNTMRSPTFKDPDELLDWFRRYQAHTKAHPRHVARFVGWQGRQVYEAREVPLTFLGFECWLSSEGVCHDLSNYQKGMTAHHRRFSDVLRRIRLICEADMLDGALTGVYKACIVWRLLQLPHLTHVYTNDPKQVPVFTGQ